MRLLDQITTRLAALALALAAFGPAAHPAAAEPRAAAPAPVVRLYVLNCGYLRTGDVSHWGLIPGEVDFTDMAVPCYLVRHGRDWLMFDTGLGDAHFGKADRIGSSLMEVPQALGPQLAALGLSPARIGRVAISHSHFDHVGNLDAFPRARVLIQRAEAERVRAKPYPFTPAAAVARLAGPNVEVLDGDLDVFGDGTVRLLATPGHSPGHQSLLVRLPHTGAVLLTGDLWHYPAEKWLHRVPPSEAAGETAASRTKIEELVRREQAILWIAHDIGLYKSQRHAPAFYD